MRTVQIQGRLPFAGHQRCFVAGLAAVQALAAAWGALQAVGLLRGQLGEQLVHSSETGHVILSFYGRQGQWSVSGRTFTDSATSKIYHTDCKSCFPHVPNYSVE